MLLALDDTDTPHGGCTTLTALRLAAALERAGGALATWGLTDAPRLVRLNPAAPHKTRGNGALVLPVGPRAADTPLQPIGRFAGRTLHVGAAAAASRPTAAQVDAITALVARHLPGAGADDADPQPGAVLLPSPPASPLYARGVSRLVAIDEAWASAPPGTLRLTADPRRGEIGALAAAAWPRDRWTWECIAYRAPGERETERHVPSGFADAVKALPGGFDNLDPETGRLRSVPRTPCPVRWGLRGRDPEALLAAQEALGADDHWLVQTNHATADHARHSGATPAPHAMVHGTFSVSGPPRRGPGGHLFVPSRDARGAPCTLAAFEPTKTLRDAIGEARAGDELTILGRSAGDATVVAVEAFCFTAAPPRREKLANPRCARCQGAMKSIGTDAGYRCRPCGTHTTEASATTLVRPGPTMGTVHQVPDHVRGHLLPPVHGIGVVRALDGHPGPPIGPLVPRKGATAPSLVSQAT